MPAITLSEALTVIRHDNADDFLSFAYPTLRHHEQSSNIILAHALERSISQYSPVDQQMAHSGLRMKPSMSDSFWLTVWSSTSLHTLDLALSCINSTLGKYPIFLWTSHHPSAMSLEWLMPRIVELTQHLQACVPQGRVFSVFGRSSLVKAFSQHWVRLTGSSLEPEPFYTACSTFCTPMSLRDSDHQIPHDHRIRMATMHDLDSIAKLCQEFADSSIFFPLTIDKARIEAEEIISHSLIWIYEVLGQIASICVVGRESQRVAAITKVYTTPAWRRNGFAEHLLRNITKLLFARGKESVVLNVAYDNGAMRVYDQVGFVGLNKYPKPDGVEDVLELGFKGADRGHW